MLRLPLRLAALLLAPLLVSCSTLGYYAESIGGHMQIIGARQSVADLLAEDNLDPTLRRKLQLSQRARDFATRELFLPDNGSYRSYVDIGRPYAVWNVIAAKEFSVDAKTWCFMFTGCVAYRGYFDRDEARAYAAKLRHQGYDTYVAGALAYSTLGWFDDPLLNTMLNRPEASVVGLIFHELAHQLLYIKGDSAFNEAFATVVEREGVRRWFLAQGDPAAYKAYLEAKARKEAFFAMVNDTRERLRSLYARPLPAAEKRRRKHEVLHKLATARYRAYKADWNGYSGFDGWMEQDLNNAHLALIATYNAWVPALEGLLSALHGDLKRFYAEARHVAEMGPDAEDLRLASTPGPQQGSARLVSASSRAEPPAAGAASPR